MGDGGQRMTDENVTERRINVFLAWAAAVDSELTSMEWAVPPMTERSLAHSVAAEVMAWAVAYPDQAKWWDDRLTQLISESLQLEGVDGAMASTLRFAAIQRFERALQRYALASALR